MTFLSLSHLRLVEARHMRCFYGVAVVGVGGVNFCRVFAVSLFGGPNVSCVVRAKSIEIWPRGYKLFSFSTQLSMKFFLLINVKMPTIVGILTFMSEKNSILSLSEPKKADFFFL